MPVHARKIAHDGPSAPEIPPASACAPTPQRPPTTTASASVSRRTQPPPAGSPIAPPPRTEPSAWPPPPSPAPGSSPWTTPGVIAELPPENHRGRAPRRSAHRPEHLPSRSPDLLAPPLPAYRHHRPRPRAPGPPARPTPNALTSTTASSSPPSGTLPSIRAWSRLPMPVPITSDALTAEARTELSVAGKVLSGPTDEHRSQHRGTVAMSSRGVHVRSSQTREG
jgi:hypothetical protein